MKIQKVPIRVHKRQISILMIVGFMSTVIGLVALANMLVYRVANEVFAITSYAGHAICFGVLFSLSFGFVIMLAVEKYVDSLLVRLLYGATAIWMGAFVYIFFASVVFRIVGLFVLEPHMFGILLFCIAGVISMYGLVCGQKIIVTNISVSLPNVPKEWCGKTAIWMSDLHLGSLRGSRFAKKVTRLSNSFSPDIVFIGGDLYDGTQARDPLRIAQPLKELSSHYGVFFVAGNHEEFGDPSPFMKAIRELGVCILDNELREIEGIQIIGVDYSAAASRKQFESILEHVRIDTSKPSILLKHEPKDLDVAFRAGVSFQISGHTHHGQQWPFTVLTDVVYKGYGYGLKKFQTMFVYVSSGIGGWGPPVRVGTHCELVRITFE